MQAHLLVGPTPVNGFYSSSFFISNGSLSISASPFTGNWPYPHNSPRKSRNRWIPPPSSSFASAAGIDGEQNHYSVLGVARNASSADIKRAYRLLALKYHPDVSKDSQAGEMFKSIRHAYEVLSNEVTRVQYDRALTFQEDVGRSYKGKWNNSPEFEDGVRQYRWAEIKRKMQEERFGERYKVNDEYSSFYDETDDEEEDENLHQERGSFIEVLKSAFITLFLLQTFGSLFSLTFSSLMALFDKKLDAGYKIGYVVAWVLGGRGGILLTLCIAFASWVCGKTSSSIVVLVVVAMWVGSNLARYAPLPQGALLALMYMSIKLQVDLK
ncbi:PREDICTED: dnaJ homolog subfamily C member 18 [Theobroma cacao]|uniref:DnaJ homolog subfamily C member 18 n=1 Tax=Theobroma cacao TaxID=3641 RepID=A0AB32V4W6_THECC|nr:PREDICTED: dnaJ homolog subfamily C member 18 [Theobroma cacao]